jgi:HK97 family phage portal protein
MKNPFLALFERRSISDSADLYAFLTKGSQNSAGAAVTEATAFNVAAVMTCISLISRTVASLPLGVYERTADDSRQPATRHPLVRALRQPNAWQTTFAFVQMMQAHTLLRGNAFAWANWSTTTFDGSEQLIELIPIHPDRMIVEQPDEFNPPQYTLERRNGTRLPIPADEILHLQGLSTDGVLGRPVLRDAREVLGGALATQTYAGEFWSNDATPDVVLRHPRALSDKAKHNLETSFAETYGRGKDRRRVAVLEEGIEIEKVTLSAQDSQFLETRKFQRSEIAGWFHVPPHMIGDTEKSTSWGTGIEQQQIGFLTFTILPWLTMWEQRLDQALVKNPARFFCKFKLEGWLRGDINSRYMAYARGVQNGWLSPNDVRRLEDMNPIDGGDVYLAPTNLAPLASLEDLVASQVKAAIEEKSHAS